MLIYKRITLKIPRENNSQFAFLSLLSLTFKNEGQDNFLNKQKLREFISIEIHKRDLKKMNFKKKSEPLKTSCMQEEMMGKDTGNRVLGWPKRSFVFSITSYRITRTNSLANPVDECKVKIVPRM